VGHSFGAYSVRVFSGLYPEKVLGIVLVDGSHPDEEWRINAILTPAQLAIRKQSQVGTRWDDISEALKLHFGGQRIALALGFSRSPHLSAQLQRENLYLQQLPKYLRTVEAENSLWGTSGAQAVAAGSFGNRPLIVLTAGKPYEPDPLLTPEQARMQDHIWIHDLQVEEMHLSSRGRQIIVPDSGHDIPTERPDAIVSAIDSVWSAVR
jgi:pimeloyl-ACP methyl ester carboxylesterase